MFLERFQQVVRRQPAAIAVEEGDLRLSYRDLDARARGVVARLVRAGVGREAVVGLGVRKSADYLVGLLGVWYAGAAFLPLDPDLPSARLRFMLGDAMARCVLTRAGDAASFHFPEGPCRVDLAECREDLWVSGHRTVDDLAYVIYTSGSTGVPKGVAVTHRGIVNLIDGQIPAFGLTPESRVLWLLSTSFDASVSDVGTALLAGATLCIEPGDAVETASRLLRTVNRRGVTHLDLPPALLAILEVEAAPDCLETLIIGGEPCPAEVVRRWARRCRVVNVYGPTEATVCSSLCLCDADTWSRPLLGQPLPNVSYRVLNEELQTVSIGVPGELYIGGAGLARGYVGRPELDAARFLMVDGERMYRTGDRVVLHTDGEFEFRGRIDRQVKIRGQLVSPEEVERCLLAHPGVTQAAVIKHDCGGREAWVAFVVPAGNSPGLNEAGLREHLRTHLPVWMLPGYYVCLPTLPVTRTGKTDLHALASLSFEVAADGERVEPRDDQETALLQVWQAVLGRGDFGVTDDFFALGGDSLGVLRLVAAAEAQGIACPPGLLMACRTVRGVIEGTRVVSSTTTEGRSVVALRREVARYEAELRPHGLRGGASVASAAAPRRILLTGATGFLGARLLYELLTQTGAEVICLVRAASPAAGIDRCVRAVQAHDLTLAPAELKRLQVVCGDLGEPHFGLAEELWCCLCARIDTVLHCGAWVHLVHPFETLRAANLGGTAEILRLVGSGRPKRLHYVSTLSVLVASDRNVGRLREDDDLSGTGVVYGGYAQSKWAAEVLVRKCSDPGAAAIYRLGLITGDTRTGYVPKHDQLGLFLRGLAELGCYPADMGERLRVDITPVDYAATALVRLAVRVETPPGETYHIASRRGATLQDLAEAVRRAGASLAEVTSAEWRRRLAAAGPARGSEAASTASVSLCRGAGDATGFARQRTLDLFQATDTEFAMEHTQAGLKGTGLWCPEASPELLDLYVWRALRAGEPR